MHAARLPRATMKNPLKPSLKLKSLPGVQVHQRHFEHQRSTRYVNNMHSGHEKGEQKSARQTETNREYRETDRETESVCGCERKETREWVGR